MYRSMRRESHAPRDSRSEFQFKKQVHESLDGRSEPIPPALVSGGRRPLTNQALIMASGCYFIHVILFTYKLFFFFQRTIDS